MHYEATLNRVKLTDKPNDMIRILSYLWVIISMAAGTLREPSCIPLQKLLLGKMNFSSTGSNQIALCRHHCCFLDGTPNPALMRRGYA